MRIVTGLLLSAMLVGCAAEKIVPGNTEYRKTTFNSVITVTGNDVPGPLRVREVSAWLNDGEETLLVSMNTPVSATVEAWVNGHGAFVGHWERDGEIIDTISAYITYGETLRISLGPAAFPTHREGHFKVRFVIEKPLTALTLPTLIYEIPAR